MSAEIVPIPNLVVRHALNIAKYGALKYKVRCKMYVSEALSTVVCKFYSFLLYKSVFLLSAILVSYSITLLR